MSRSMSEERRRFLKSNGNWTEWYFVEELKEDLLNVDVIAVQTELYMTKEEYKTWREKYDAPINK